MEKNINNEMTHDNNEFCAYQDIQASS